VTVGGLGLEVPFVAGEEMRTEISAKFRPDGLSSELTVAGLPLLDLRGLSFMDSTGLRFVVTADQRARQAGRRLAVVQGPGAIQRVFEITRLGERLDIVADPAEL
jgi:anti-anti-sigma factor